MRLMRAVVVGWLGLVVAHGALASEASKLLHSRGLVAFHAGKLDEALKLFDQAVEADPSDAYARYYRGVTRARLGNPEGAVQDLEQVVREKPELDQAALDLGIALVETQRFEEALAPLDQVLERAESNDTIAQASLFKGIAHLRLGHIDRARSALDTALARDPSLPAAHYYAGVVAFSDGYLDAAEAHFEAVVAARRDSAIGKESLVFLDRIRDERSNNYELFGAVGFQYDSNVILSANNGDVAQIGEDVLGVSRQDDGRVTVDLGGYYLLGRTDWARLTVGYEFYQSSHFELHDFDLQQHEPMSQLEFIYDRFRVGAIVRYNYYFLDYDDFLRQFNGQPFAGVSFGSFGQLETYTRVLRRDFLQPDFNGTDFRLRDGWNFAPGATQRFYLMGDASRSIIIGYQYDQDEPDAPEAQQPIARRFAYVGHQASVGLSWFLPFDIDATAEYAYRTEKYADESRYQVSSTGAAEQGPRRDDTEHHIILVASRSITEHFGVSLGYFGLFNDSNKSAFDYERHIGSIALEARF